MTASSLVPIVIALTVRLPGGAPKTQPDPWFGPDKVKHFLVSVFVQSASYGALRATGVGHRPSLAGASVMTLTVGIGKELQDRRGSGAGQGERDTGLFSVKDLTWDIAGGVAASVMVNQGR